MIKDIIIPVISIIVSMVTAYITTKVTYKRQYKKGYFLLIEICKLYMVSFINTQEGTSPINSKKLRKKMYLAELKYIRDFIVSLLNNEIYYELINEYSNITMLLFSFGRAIIEQEDNSSENILLQHNLYTEISNLYSKLKNTFLSYPK